MNASPPAPRRTAPRSCRRRRDLLYAAATDGSDLALATLRVLLDGGDPWWREPLDDGTGDARQDRRSDDRPWRL